MIRIVLWVLAALYLLLVGLWPAAAAPIGLVAAGAAVVVGLIPGPVLALGAAAAWLKYRAAHPATPTA
ncbi:hypothetical protein ABZ742_04075 [Streptomyces albogriseolus]|uniref:hypothetical protein n=1 Tax=Streptomyces TaxID=1883 RepID=UPI0024496F30|nr:hypothetical protein [Streptomyces sp. TRM75561]MDH3037900.1 hypothetical protein [Streptomyces sp. TRM75561]